MKKDEQACQKNLENLQPVGSKINVSRPCHISVSPPFTKNRPQSATVSHELHSDFKQCCSRPKSADSFNGYLSSNHVSQYPLSWKHKEIKTQSGVSLFTNCSSKLLHSLLQSPNYTSEVTNDPELYTKLRCGTVKNISPTNNNQNYQEYQISKLESREKENKSDLENRQHFSDVEKGVVDFSKNQNEENWIKRQFREDDRFKFCYNYCSTHKRPVHHVCIGKQFEAKALTMSEISETRTSREQETYDKKKVQIIDDDALNSKSKCLKKNKMLLEQKLQPINKESLEVPSESFEKSSAISLISSQSIPITAEEKTPVQTKFGQKLEGINFKNNETKTQKDFISESKVLNFPTYEQIIHLLQSLDNEDTVNLNTDIKADSEERDLSDSQSTIPVNEVYSYLEEVEKEEKELLSQINRNSNDFKAVSKTLQSPRLEELLDKNSVELAHEILSLKIQIEDQKKGIQLLRDKLAEMKEIRQKLELEHQEALHKANIEAETLIQRHQKFIKQLINEKKNLNETVSKLVKDLKSREEKYKKNMKELEEKHLIEIKKAKEIQAAADKIRREKWMETKTQKIKEMTVKGLQPELSRMAIRQQEEMTELRSLHRAEIEAVELKAARRTSELMDQLRTELTVEKEHAIARETATLRTRMEKEFEEERNKMQNQLQVLKDQLRKEDEKLVNQEMEFQQKLLDCKRQAEKDVQNIIRDHQEKLVEERRRHAVDLKTVTESMEAEKEIWVTNYKKKQAAQFSEKEGELRQRYKKERDKDIEMVIEVLEKESTKAQIEINTAAENKLKRLREQLESEIKEMEIRETSLKNKLSETKAQILEKEDCITQLNTQIRQHQTEITYLRKLCEDMTAEKTDLKNIIKKEFESSINGILKEKENVEKNMLILKEMHLKELSKKDQFNREANNEMQKELTRVYSRMKSIVSKKEKIIESLREEIKVTNQRCEQLEIMLDRQRRNLLL